MEWRLELKYWNGMETGIEILEWNGDSGIEILEWRQWNGMETENRQVEYEYSLMLYITKWGGQLQTHSLLRCLSSFYWQVLKLVCPSISSPGRVSHCQNSLLSHC